MSDQKAYRRIRPQSGSDRRALIRIGATLLFVALAVAFIFNLKREHQEEREETWQSATALIEEVLTVPATQVESARGGAMTYTVKVLAKYVADGRTRERWIAVQQQPELLTDAQLKVFRWKGKQCVVRWNAADPEQVVAEVS